jgi:hypothetical protein
MQASEADSTTAPSNPLLAPLSDVSSQHSMQELLHQAQNPRIMSVGACRSSVCLPPQQTSPTVRNEAAACLCTCLHPHSLAPGAGAAGKGSGERHGQPAGHAPGGGHPRAGAVPVRQVRVSAREAPNRGAWRAKLRP